MSCKLNPIQIQGLADFLFGVLTKGQATDPTIDQQLTFPLTILILFNYDFHNMFFLVFGGPFPH